LFQIIIFKSKYRPILKYSYEMLTDINIYYMWRKILKVGGEENLFNVIATAKNRSGYGLE